MIRAIIMSAVLWATAAPAAGQELGRVEPVDSVTLDEAVERALEVSPQAVQARTGLTTAAYGTRQAYAAMLPNLTFSSGANLSSADRYDPQTNLRVTGQNNSSYSAGLAADVELFSGGRNVATVRRAQASVVAAEAILLTEQFAIALAAKEAYFAVLRARDLIRLNEDQIDQADQQLAAAERRLEVGRATRSDVLRARLELSNARQALLQSMTQRRDAMYRLGRTVGAPGPVAAVEPPDLTPGPLALSAEALREVVLEAAPILVSARADMGVARAGLSQARAEYFPRVGARGGYNWSNNEFGLDQGLTSWSTRLSVSYPLFNGLQREADVDRATARLTVAEARAADAARAVQAELESLVAALELAEARLAILNESVEVAREDYRVQQERYELGAATILELVSSQIARARAENDLINARYDYQIARARLESLVGRGL